MQANLHILISMASPAYNAQMAISISTQYFLAPLSFNMIAPKASFQVKVDDFNVFLQSPTIYSNNGPKNSHANSMHNNIMGQMIIVYAHDDKRQICEITRRNHNLPHNRQQDE